MSQSDLRKIFAIMVGLFGTLLALWFGVLVMFIGGIVELINAFQHFPVHGSQITLGLFRIFFSFTGWFIFAGALAGAAFIWPDPNVNVTNIRRIARTFLKS